MRIATFNIALNRPRAGMLIEELASDGSDQLRAIVEVIRHLDADVLVLNEIDYDDKHQALFLFKDRWLAQAGVEYPYCFTAPVNTGVPSGRDLVKDGTLAQGESSPFGYGDFPGQYGMAVLSKLPLAPEQSRTFQRFLWRDLPQARLPGLPDGQPFYDAEDLAIMRLSSKSHWDIPVRHPLGDFHLLVSHPTPPAFDGPEQRNVYRNFDEIRFWADYINGADYPVDDQGVSGGLPDRPFILAGDFNADPDDNGDSAQGAVYQLLSHPKTRLHTPRHSNSVDKTEFNKKTETADWGLRVDYIVPSTHWLVTDSGVFWPADNMPLADVTAAASDHRAVWADLIRSE